MRRSHYSPLRRRLMMSAVRVSKLRFSQPSASSQFKCGRSLDVLIKRLVTDPDYMQGVPPLRVLWVGPSTVSLDNRRLVCFILACKYLGIDAAVPVQFLKKSRLRGRCSRSKIKHFRASRHHGAFIRMRKPLHSLCKLRPRDVHIVRRLRVRTL